MPIIPAIQDRLRLGFPKSGDEPLYRAVQQGCYLADHLFEGEPFLANLLGQDLRGHLRRVAISYQIDRYCNLGDLPWSTEMKPMPKGPWHWLEIKGTGSVAHVCRTEDKYAFPELADSRQDIRLELQTDLFNWMDRKPIVTALEDIPRLYAWLTFGVAQDGQVSHLCWASPAPASDDYIGHIDILDEIRRSGETPPVSPRPDPRDKLRLKDFVAESLIKKTDQASSDE